MYVGGRLFMFVNVESSAGFSCTSSRIVLIPEERTFQRMRRLCPIDLACFY